MNECMNFFRKCTYEYMIFFNAYIVYVWKIFSKKKMLLWMHDFFLNAYMMYVWMIFFLWENAFMKSWTFSFWKCIYECMIFFNAYIVHVCKILFYFMRRCIYEILDFFFLKIHLWMDGFFGFIFVFFSYVCMHNLFLRMHI